MSETCGWYNKASQSVGGKKVMVAAQISGQPFFEMWQQLLNLSAPIHLSTYLHNSDCLNIEFFVL